MTALLEWVSRGASAESLGATIRTEETPPAPLETDETCPVTGGSCQYIDLVAGFKLCTYPDDRSLNVRLLSGCPRVRPKPARPPAKRLRLAKKLKEHMESDGWSFEVDPVTGELLICDGQWQPGRSIWVSWAKGYVGELAWLTLGNR